MPLPKPRRGESQDNFHARCMKNEIMKKEYPDQNKRNVICYSQWENTSNMEFIVQTNSGYQIREVTHQGRKHLIVPVIMLVEGVHSGSHGALYHSPDEYGRYPAAWNGIPVVVNHPSRDGVSVSANDPEVLENEKVGTVFNTQVEDGKLKAEMWLDEQKLVAVSPSTCERIKQGEVLEVSTGVFNDQEQKQGSWNNEQYTAVAHNHRPDHLALLPDDAGACSVADGCGIRENKEGGDMTTENSILSIFKKGGEMSKTKNDEPCCPEKVDQLIANKLSRWTEDDKEELLALNEETLNKMFPIEQKEVNEPTDNTEGSVQEDEKKISKEDIVEALKDVDTDTYLKLAPTEVAEQLKEGLRLNKEKRATLIKVITENSKFNEEGLKAWSTEDLQNMYEAVAPTDYSGLGGGDAPGTYSEEDEVEPLGDPWERRKKEKEESK